jgi:hypothetical protein
MDLNGFPHNLTVSNFIHAFLTLKKMSYFLNLLVTLSQSYIVKLTKTLKTHIVTPYKITKSYFDITVQTAFITSLLLQQHQNVFNSLTIQ